MNTDEGHPMDLDELLAVVAAPIYAARLGAVLSRRGELPKSDEAWIKLRNNFIQASVEEARLVWDVARTRRVKV